MKHRVLVALVLGCIGAETAHGNNLKNCIATVAEIDLSAKLAFQDGMRDFIVAEAPEYGDLARLNRDLQVGLAQSRYRRLQYLMFTDPARLRIDGTVSKLMNFDWSATDDAGLSATSKSFAASKGAHC